LPGHRAFGDRFVSGIVARVSDLVAAQSEFKAQGEAFEQQANLGDEALA
jgi:hypothetical protein